MNAGAIREPAAPDHRAADDRFLPISSLMSAGLICKELSRAAVSILTQPRRDRRRVQQEYDRGYWTDILRARRWESCRSLDEFLNPAEAGWRVCKIDNRFVRARSSDYYRERNLRLCRLLEERTERGTDLIEVGAGYGANLFALASSPHWRQLIGLELSETGVAAGRAIAQHFKLSDRIRFERADLTNLSETARDTLSGRVAFSYYCFEQIPRDTESAIRNLLAARPRRVVHIEPVAELLRWFAPKDLVNYAHILANDYQRSLLRTLRGFSAQNELRILEVERLYYAPGIRHDPALVAWEPLPNQSGPRNLT
jgi:SAM-dependent methyltransferase